MGAAQSSELVLDHLNVGVLGVDRDLRVVCWNVFMATNSGKSAAEVVGRGLFECFPDLHVEWLSWKFRTVFDLGTHAFSSWRQHPYIFHFPHNRPLTGGIDCMRQDAVFLPVLAEGEVVATYVVISDVTDAALAELDLAAEMRARSKAEVELRQAQKLESVGRLAAGVAHEINTPIQFISDSIHFVRTASESMMQLLTQYRELCQSLGDGPHSAAAAAIGEAEANVDLEYLVENVPRALESSVEGLERVATIVRSMKEFAHPEQTEMTYADLNRAVTSTVRVASHECKYVADLELELGDIPPVYCFLGDINQVVLNLVVNAAHAIGDVVGDSGAKGRITVRTASEGDSVLLSVSDTGGGIPAAIRDLIYDPFFTTKAVGKGTGQGLSIARSVIVDKHGGELWFETTPGAGTTFRIRLPVAGRAQRVA